jgi:hypothetical protein
MARNFAHTVALYDGMTPDSRERVLDTFDDLLADYGGEDIRITFARAVALEFDAIERRMLRERQSEGTA